MSIRLWSNRPVDLVVAEARMEGTSGLALGEKIRSAGWPIPMIFLTAADDVDACRACENLQFPVLPKPVRMDRLRGLVFELARVPPSPREQRAERAALGALSARRPRDWCLLAVDSVHPRATPARRLSSSFRRVGAGLSRGACVAPGGRMHHHGSLHPVGSFRSLASRLSLFAGAACVALVSGCSAPASSEHAKSSGAALSSDDQAAYEFFVGKGLTDFQAAGIVGNLDQESGVDPTAVQYGGGPGRGIAQWSVGGRWDTDARRQRRPGTRASTAASRVDR